jgi:type IV pilus assembly protein PilE
MNEYMRKSITNRAGFTLVELLIVIVIIGLLMAYALPSYKRQVIFAKRTDAHNSIMKIASAQERNYATYNQYAATINSGATPNSGDLGLAGVAFMTSVDYNFTMDNTNGYTITATAVGSSQIDDDFGGNDCTTLTLDSLGQKLPLPCWQ